MWIKALKWLVIVGIALGLVYGIYVTGEHAGASRVQAEWNRAESDHSDRILELEREARQREKDHADAVSEISDQLHEELTNVKTESDRIIADLRDGNRVLRDRFKTRPACGSQPTASASGGYEAGEGGLHGQDVEFLIHIASEADAIAERLTSCQNILRVERQ